MSPTTVAAATKVVMASATLSNPGIGETVRRTRGRLWVGSDQQVATEDYVGAFGIIVVSDLALAAGAASIPGPVTDRNDDGWLVWESTANRFQLGSNIGFESNKMQMIEFDSRAMRKVEEGFGLAFMFENASPADGCIVTIGVSQYATRN